MSNQKHHEIVEIQKGNRRILKASRIYNCRNWRRQIDKKRIRMAYKRRRMMRLHPNLKQSIDKSTNL